MKIQQLSPAHTPWREGTRWLAGGWSALDTVDSMGDIVRVVSHYSTPMCEFVAQNEEGTEWWCGVLSVGRGSVSDQNGMNQLLASVGSEVRYWRDGGKPRYAIGRNGNPIATPRD
jgi:hypothetical protein